MLSKRGGRGGQKRRSLIRVNRQIRAREIRVIDHDGSPLGVMSTDDALERARELDLDLVEVAPTAQPPVCKVIDYGKYKYLQKKKEQEAKKKQSVTLIKEIKLRPRTDQHDREYKMRNIRRFLEEGNKAKVTIRFRGREIVYAKRAGEILKQIADDLKELGKIEKEPIMAGRTMSMVLAPLSKSKS